jgi:hypothetical protein
MSQDIRSGLLFECETELQGDDVSWEDDQGFGLTDTE